MWRLARLRLRLRGSYTWTAKRFWGVLLMVTHHSRSRPILHALGDEHPLCCKKKGQVAVQQGSHVAHEEAAS